MFDRLFAKDYWLTLDKLWHFIGCLVITVVWGFQTAGIIGFLKECADIGGSGFSYKDLTADFIGIAFGLLIRSFVGLL